MKIQRKTADRIREIGLAMLEKQRRKRRERLRTLNCLPTLESVIAELCRVWEVEDARHEAWKARKRATSQAKREVARQAADENITRWEQEGGTIAAAG
jgi:hypothetical protein